MLSNSEFIKTHSIKTIKKTLIRVVVLTSTVQPNKFVAKFSPYLITKLILILALYIYDTI